MQYPEPISKLIDSYMRLPGIGAKTATRLAFYTIDMNKDDVTAFAKSLVAAKEDLHYCSICGNITDEDPCAICRDKNRDQSTILVVEQPKDVMSIDRAQDYHGLYHVLHGVLSPIEGRGPEDLNIESLLKRLKRIPPSRKSLLRPMQRQKGKQQPNTLRALSSRLGLK
ncbi:recombinase RecR [Lacticaseibacillus rhamnosus 2166]|nr:recombinase RecR [Lacticaseibacillus rhamnosus 2166]